MTILECLRRVFVRENKETRDENQSIELSRGDDASGEKEWAAYCTPKEHDRIIEMDKRESRPV